MNKLTFMLGALILVFAVGCMSPRVPETVIKTPFGEFRGPKDMEIEGLEFIRNTNGVVVISAKIIRSRNNPDAIQASTAQIDAHYAGASKVVEKGVEAGIKAAAKSAVP